MSVLVVAEHDNQSLKPSTLSAIQAASQLCEEIKVLVAGFECQAVVEQLKPIKNVQEILVADHTSLQHPLAESLAPLIARVSKDVTHVLAPATTFGKNILPRAAAINNVGMISDIIAVMDQNTYQRPIYAGNVIITVRSTDTVQFLTVRPTAFPHAESENHEATVKSLEVNDENNSSQFVRLELANTDRPELSSADIVISGGRGMRDAEHFQRLVKIADRLGAAIGASRAAVDAGLATNDLQVGQTGQVVAPKLYIAVGISGAIQHLAGMKDSKIIVAINKDPDAPIFQVADYGLVADLFEVLPKWEAILTQMGY